MYLTIGALKRLSSYMAGQLASAIAVTGGTIAGTTINSSAIGGTTPAAGAFTTLAATSLTTTGVNTLSVANALTATGTDRTTSLVLSKAINNIKTAAAGSGVTLPAGVPGQIITVFNNGTAAIQVYGNGSDTIDGVAGSTGVVLTNAKRAIYVCVAANTIISAQLGVVSA